MFIKRIFSKFLIVIIILFIVILKTFNNPKKKIDLKYDKYKFSYYTNLDNLYLINLTYVNYSLSFKEKIIKVEYNVGFYNENNILINPSDLTLYNNLHIICNFYENIKNRNIIYSLPNIYNNQFYKCIEFFNISQNVRFGINIVQKYYDYYSNKYMFLFDNKIINYNNLNNNNNYEFNQLLINKLYISLIDNIKYNKEKNTSLKLIQSYMKYPIFCTKTNIIINNWTFINIYNNYFCLCSGKNCSYVNINQECKYFFYLNIIDINKNIYIKTDYLFCDFLSANRASDDTYPIFQEMIKLNLPSHYLTEKKSIYKEYCQKIKKCLSIILINKETLIINGNFLESYLTLFLRLKAAITGANFLFINNLFYNIDYITFISVGHGIAFFKHFLYSRNRYYGHKRYNKILLPPCEKLISVAKQNGWKDNNIIKINLPRWDKYEKTIENLSISEKQNIIKKNSIFIMFTWRNCLENKNISYLYINNIFNLLYNNKITKNLKKYNCVLYFSLHPKLRYLKDKVKQNKYIIYLKEKEISNCLSRTSLLVTDFSSIIFDIICRNKPYIIYIPDAKDTKLKDIYTRDIYRIIESFKNNTFNFENIYFDLNKTVNKIIYYINNNFTLDGKLKQFYNTFSFKSGNNIKEFISYLKNLK